MILTILHTNDIHAHYESIPQIASLLKKHSTQFTFKIDAGDFVDSSNYLIAAEDGKYGAALLSNLGYDVAAIGNNEYLLKTDTLYKESCVPYVCCNLTYLDNSIIPCIKSSIIKTMNGVRFLIIGNTVNGTQSYNDILSLYNKKAHSLYECIKKELEINKGKYDFVILVSHTSYEEDIEIAQLFPEIQIIIGGHSHILMTEVERYNNAYLHISSQWGEYVGKLTLEIDDETKHILTCTAEQLPVISALPNEETKQYINSLSLQAYTILKQPLFTIPDTLHHSLTEENTLSNLLAEALYHYHECDLGIINSGILACPLNQGPISEYDLLTCIPSPLNPCYVMIDGKSIKEAYELSLDKEYVMQSGRAPGYRGTHIGTIAFSSNVKVKDNNIYINNSLIDENKDYRVMTSGYLQRGNGYPSLASTKAVKHQGILLRDVFKNYLQLQNKG